MKKFLFLFAALCLTLADAARADTDLSAYTNVIYVAPATITLDGSRVPVALDGSPVESPSDLTLSICMDNAADIRGFQFDLYLPDGMTPVKTAKGKIVAALTSARLPEDDEHTLTLAEQTDGAIRLLCGSQYDETFTGTSGEIATIKVSIAALPDGTYPVTLKAVKLTETDITKCYEVPEVVTSLNITTASDDSEEPNYANVIYVAPATITLDGASATLTLNAPTAPVASDGSPVESPSEVDLPICMDNTAAIRGFQFDLYLPDGMTAVKTAKGKIVAALTSARLPEDDEHTLTVAEETCVIIAKDDLSTAISEAEAYYDSIKDDYPYLASVLQWVIDSAKLVMTDDEATQAQVENATAAVNDAMAQAKDIMAPVTAIPTSGDKPRDAYDLSGRHVAQPTKGLYIINDKKILIK